MSKLARGKSSKAIHGGSHPDEHRGAVSVPIYQTSTFAFPNAEEGAARFDGSSRGLIYTRLGNPTIAALEACVAGLEGGCGAVGTSSGMGAISAVLLGLLSAGDHLVGTHPLYGPSRLLVETHMSRFGIASTFIGAAETTELRAALRPNTRMIYVETPANPTIDLADLRAVAEVAHQAQVPLVVDNTFAGPHLQRPIELGADVVLHSATKSLNGHADVVAGVVVTRTPELLAKVKGAAVSFGMTMDPHQAWLVLRGLRTLPLRMERAQANAQVIAEWLEARDEVAWVRYPGLRSHPQHELAQRQMDGPGAMIAFELTSGVEAGRRLMNAVRLITLAVSLGGIESLIEHPASMTHKGVPAEEQRRQGITEGLVRLAVGCEDVGDLLADLEQAFAAIAEPPAAVRQA
jgi:methionine-gamma-lyase